MIDSSRLPIKNKLLYGYRVFGKLFAFFFFGTGSIALGLALLPAMRILIHPFSRFQLAAHHLVSFTFRFFATFLQVMGWSSMTTADKKRLRALKSKILVANHPSYLDMVYILSLVPCTNVIVRGNLTKGVLGLVVSQIYIVNNKPYEKLKDECVRTLKDGNCLLIFPEGTRTPRDHHVPYKKGAARIALASGCSIVPLRIGGNDKLGLGKGDPLFSYNHTERYHYDITMLDEIDPSPYQSLAGPAAAKRIMDIIKDEIGNTVIADVAENQA